MAWIGVKLCPGAGAAAAEGRGCGASSAAHDIQFVTRQQGIITSEHGATTRPETSMNRGMILTLTSYRGGVGRTTAVANLAWLLANSGKRVMAVDWNLGAPRLGELFSSIWPDFDPRTKSGVIDALWEYVLERYRVGSRDHGEKVRDALTEKAIELAWNFRSGGKLHFLNAGLVESYRVRRRLFPWDEFYGLGGRSFIEDARESLRQRYDCVVIDGPLLLEDTSALVTLGLADAVAFCCLAGGNDIEATSTAAAKLADAVRTSSFDRAFRLFPVLMRADGTEQALLQRTRARMQAAFSRLPFGPVDPTLPPCEVPYTPYYSYANPLGAAWKSGDLIRAYLGLLSTASGEEPPPFFPPSSDELERIEARSQSLPTPVSFEFLCASGESRELRPCTATAGYFFVSYRRQHFKRITVTLDQIQKMGFEVWWDEGIPGGTDWKAELAQRIESCRAMLLFFDETGTGSVWVQWELQTARQFGKKIVPIQLDNAEPGPEVDEYVRQLQFLQDPGAQPSRELETTLRRLSL